jgi:hypothetical protein
MPIKDFVAYTRPPASDLNRYPVQQAHVIKTSDTSRASTTTNTDDPHLVMDVDANTNYWVTLFLIYSAGPTPDIKIGFAAPSGSVFNYVSDAIGSTATSTVSTVSRTLQGLGSTPSPGGVTDNTVRILALPKGVLRVGSTSGSFRFQWSQLSSSVQTTIVRQNSILILRRLTD